ncbi:keratin, type I cytoskeletal 9-like [Seriola lalandi dorsalis]|uniref:Plasmalemma vesicle associated protein a n=1 Tax=Seriola lalandi dorsalis TaxID=1841481 RepID=A0A3B4YDL2_SERLL|nr:keratin, type I cytoskeletal 9-like [Seriola lalandi dorsalis]XP_056246653.1 plasmalemma vesicle associated protein a [Seriola aureovittata]
MYSSGYSQVSKHNPQAQKRMQYRSKGKSCGYYMRIVFFFSSLIQSLIIVSLVLFLVYGKNQDSASTARIQDLEESFSRLSIENVGLRQQRKNLTTLLNATLTEKARNDYDLVKIRHLINVSVTMIQDLEKRHQQCNGEMMMFRVSGQGCKLPMPVPDTCNCGMLFERMKAKLDLVESNFTQTIKTMRVEVEQTARERDYINLEAIRLRRDKSTQEKELQFYKQRCKEDFSQSLSGVSNVSKAFLLKIESLFPAHIAFQLTCPKQREHLEQIRANCTNLSREVEDRLQRYLNTVGEQVSEIQAENSRFKAENWRLSEDYRWCTQNRSGLIQEHKQNFEKLQRKHDQDKEKLLMEKMRLIGEKEVLEQSVRYKSKEVDHLTVQVKHLNMSCVRKPQFGGSTTQLGTSSQSGWNWSNGGGSSSAASSSTGRVGGLGSSFGSSGTQFNKLGSTGTGSSSSSFGSIPSLGSSGTGFNKLGSTGTGSSSSSFGSSSSLGSSSTGFNKLGSTGTGSSSSSFGSSSSLGSSSTGFNKLGSTGTGSSSSSFSSLGSNPSLSSSGIGSNKPALGARGSSTIGSSSGSFGSSSSLGSSGIGANKPTSNAKSSQGFGSWFGIGNGNSGQSKPGSGTGKVLSSGSSYGGTGSSLGRTNGVGGGSVNVAQHLQELQRIINPSGPQDKQDLSRMLG